MFINRVEKNLTLILFKNKIFKIFILKIIEYYGIA